MLQNQTCLRTADNSGAKYVYVIKPVAVRNSRFVYCNGLLKVSVRSMRKRGKILVKLGHMYLALLIRTKFCYSRFNGNSLHFSNNFVVLLDIKKNCLPYGTRIFGCVTRELRLSKYLRILLLALLVV